jgi:hypothetical protein
VAELPETVAFSNYHHERPFMGAKGSVFLPLATKADRFAGDDNDVEVAVIVCNCNLATAC